MELFTNRKRRKAVEEIDKHIEKLILDAKSKEEITTVMALMEKRDNLNKNRRKLEPATIAAIITVAGNLLGIALIISYEQWAPITSKALPFVIRGRV
jgi:hypothetical protein